VSAPSLLELYNGVPVARSQVPRLPLDRFEVALADRIGDGARLAALCGRPCSVGEVELLAVLVDGDAGTLAAVAAVVGTRYQALTPRIPQAHLFERELAEQWGIVPVGHPWLKPVRYQRSEIGGRDAWGRQASAEILPCVTDFYRVEGDEIHEVAVGPVHAGVIEPGHFRFQCHGEVVLHLEIALGYQHRGVERALVGGPGRRTINEIETLAGDTTIGHATAYCQALEGLAHAAVPPRADALRAIALELERMANHVGDLGALAGDVGYLPTQSFCGRLRGELLNMTALICGNRFGRGVVRPGGVAFDLEQAHVDRLRAWLTEVLRDVREAVELLTGSTSAVARLEGTGVVSKAQALEAGLVGVAARACGLDRDVRAELPTGMYRFAQVPMATWHSGDVFARTWVRWQEVERSAAFVLDQLAALPVGAARAGLGPLAHNALVVTMVEGWRGELCHVTLTDNEGCFERYKVVDPSFHNWTGLALALRGEQISDFPLCNKSFNLSYCGHDL
jgi:Ni,Fe-hydrogenase III large subunit